MNIEKKMKISFKIGKRMLKKFGRVSERSEWGPFNKEK
jgi:hypothetical protein